MNSAFGAYTDEFTDTATTVSEGPLAGRQVAVKDLLVMHNGHPTTAASKLLGATMPIEHSFRSPYESTVTAKLLAAGAVISGKTDLDEFAMGSSTENSAIGGTGSANPCVNPWDPTRVPGGTSGGSVVAVAARLVDLAIGTDTGGSIRQPASFCGVVGVKPTYGRVSRYGVIADASSLDQVGTIAHSVEDAALLLGVIAGHDPHDATSVPDQPVPDYTKALTGDVKGLKVGLPEEYFIDGIEPDVEQAVDAVAQELKGLGAELIEVSLPHTEHALPTYYIIQPAEASSNLARYDGIRYGNSAEYFVDNLKDLEDVYYQTRSAGFGDEVQRRIMLGTFVLSSGYYDAYYKKAMQVRTLICRDFEQVFTQCDVLLTPTAPTTAFKRGEKTGEPLQMYLQDVFTVPASLAGLPGVSVPCGFDQQGLPIGAQIIGPQWSEELLLRVADSYQRQHDWHERKPNGGPE